VYIAGRSKDSIYRVISTIKSTFPKSTGRLGDLYLDLGDLSTIKASAQDFLAKEIRLDVLFNNAGVMSPPQGSMTAQGYELQLGTNCLGAFLLTQLLAPVLSATTRVHGGSRVLWLSSSAAERFSPQDGVVMGNLNYKDDKSAWHKYGVSKAGNILYAAEFARRNAKSGILSIVRNATTPWFRHAAESIELTPIRTVSGSWKP
jgi:retinol dehydrogenase-12